MSDWINGKWEKWTCDAIDVVTGESRIRCNKPAKLRKFNDANVSLCDSHFKLTIHRQRRMSRTGLNEKD